MHLSTMQPASQIVSSFYSCASIVVPYSSHIVSSTCALMGNGASVEFWPSVASAQLAMACWQIVFPVVPALGSTSSHSFCYIPAPPFGNCLFTSILFLFRVHFPRSCILILVHLLNACQMILPNSSKNLACHFLLFIYLSLNIHVMKEQCGSIQWSKDMPLCHLISFSSCNSMNVWL